MIESEYDFLSNLLSSNTKDQTGRKWDSKLCLFVRSSYDDISVIDQGGNPLKKVYKLLLFFCLLNIVDYSTTMVAISHGAKEANPIADYFVSRDALHFFKLVGVGLLCLYLIHAAKRNFKSQLRVIKVLWGANLAYSLIVVYNAVVYFVQKYDLAQTKFVICLLGLV